MNSHALHHAFVIALLAVAPVAVAQTGAAAGGSSDTATPSAASGGGHDASMAHKSTHHASRARTHERTSTAGRSTGGSGNAEYDAALRRCVQMNGDGRDRCLDEAISRYGS